MNTYTKLRSGNWGVRVVGSAASGQSVTVTRKDGQTRVETIERVVWEGNGVSLCAIQNRQTPTPRSGRSRGTWTGCSCGSIEEYSRTSDCRTCQHDAE